MDDCIDYGYRIGRKKKQLTQNELFPHINRNTLQKMTLERSEKIRDEQLGKIHFRDVYISLDGSKLCYKPTVDVVVYSYSSDGKLETFLLDSYEPKDYSTDSFKKIGTDAVDTLIKHLCRVPAIIIDGLPAQKAAFDPNNNNSIQFTKGGKFNNIFFVYCRCHIINLVIEELTMKSSLMMKAKNQVRQISVHLRKSANAKKLGKICPEPIDIRFCYDFKIVDFLVKNIKNIDIHIQYYVFCYGIILEVLWDLYGDIEKRNATVASSYYSILKAIEQFKTIAKMTECVCLRNNCYRVIDLINDKFDSEKDLARTAFSLTLDGRHYYQELAFDDGREILLLKSSEPKHQRIRNYFLFVLAPTLFPSLDASTYITIESQLNNWEEQTSDEDEEEEWEYSDSDSDSQDQQNDIHLEDDEDEIIPLDEPKLDDYDIVETGINVINDWAISEGLGDTYATQLGENYIKWLSNLTNTLVEKISNGSENSYELWMKMGALKGKMKEYLVSKDLQE